MKWNGFATLSPFVTLLYLALGCGESDNPPVGSGASGGTGGSGASGGTGGVGGVGGSAGAGVCDPSPLLLGWFTASPLHAAKQEPYWTALEQAGANFLVAYAGSYEENPDFTWTTDFLDRAQARNIRVAAQIPTDILEAGDEAALRSFAETVGPHPALYGWYVDEPGCCGSPVTPDMLARTYAAMKAVDDHPFVVVLAGQKSTCDYDRDYLASIDEVMSENYPIKQNTEEFAGVFSQTNVAEACSQNDGALDRDGYIAIVQGFGLDEDGNPQFDARDPTYRELRYMLFTTLVRDTGGVVHWVDYRANEAVKANVNEVLHEASSTMSVLAPGIFAAPEVRVSDSAVATRWATGPCGTQLLAVNEAGGVPGEARQGVSFTLPVGIEGGSMEVLFDDFDESTRTYRSRSIPLEADATGQLTFSDDFDPYEVHLYELR